MSRTMLLGLLAASATLYPMVARAEFCAGYRQTASNAGACDSCTVSLSRRGGSRYAVTASNGWHATVTRGPGGTASGQGEWPDTGQSFTLTLTETGTDGASMTMKGSGLNVQATLRCTRR